ncbi:MAG: biopolymer transporter ExbD [Bacteroidota bacterium]
MSKFKPTKQRMHPEVSTASLPDIIFMLLFFFMVVTVLREHQVLVKVKVPEATEIEKLRHRSLVNHIYIGQPIHPQNGTAPVIQINDAFIQIEQLQHALKALEQGVPEYQRSLMTNNLKVDREVNMGIVSDVKIEMRKAKQLKVNYAAFSKK